MFGLPNLLGKIAEPIEEHNTRNQKTTGAVCLMALPRRLVLHSASSSVGSGNFASGTRYCRVDHASVHPRAAVSPAVTVTHLQPTHRTAAGVPKEYRAQRPRHLFSSNKGPLVPEHH